MYRRVELIATVALLATMFTVAPGCSRSETPDRDAARRVLILGVDGMDPRILGRLMEAGRMPNFSRLAEQGTFMPLETSAPPQSPVAWSNFISGAKPDTHEIYDFIHRDPSPDTGGMAVMPYLSTSDVEPPSRDWAISFGDWQIPLFGATPIQMRRGTAFWDDLIAGGVHTTIYRLPANYPPPDIGGRRFDCICGMGTPDLLGTYGEFTFFTPDAPVGGRNVGGGRFERLRIRRHRGKAKLLGPDNFLRKPDA